MRIAIPVFARTPYQKRFYQLCFPIRRVANGAGAAEGAALFPVMSGVRLFF
jgi:hypothetical protein